MTSGFFNYLKLIANDTPYARKMTRLRNTIFGDIVRPTSDKSMKVFKLLSKEPHYKRNYITNYYPRHVETGHLMRNLRNYGLFRDEHADFHIEMIRLRALRGKVKKRNYKGDDPNPVPGVYIPPKVKDPSKKLEAKSKEK